jgi:hypothetical protein
MRAAVTDMEMLTRSTERRATPRQDFAGCPGGTVVVVVVVPGAAVVVVVPGATVVVVVVPGATVVVVVVVGAKVTFAAATCMNASMLRSAIANDTTTGVTKAPDPIKRFKVERLCSSIPCRAPSRFRLVSLMKQLD